MCRAPAHHHGLLLSSCVNDGEKSRGSWVVHSVPSDLLALVYEQKMPIYSGTFSKLKHKILFLSNGTFSATGEGTSLYVLRVLM